MAGRIQLLVSSYDEYVWLYGIEKPGIPTLKCLARAKVRSLISLDDVRKLSLPTKLDDYITMNYIYDIFEISKSE